MRHEMGFSFQSDAELIRACREGEAEAWDTLLIRYQGLILAVGLRMGLKQADAEDVFQNVCISLYQHLDSLRDESRLASWLASATRQEVWRLHRKRIPLPLDDLPETPQPSPEDSLLEQEDQHLVRVAFQDLSEECRQLLAKLYATDPPLAYTEVAQQLSLAVGSIGPKRARCLQRLKKNLERLGF